VRGKTEASGKEDGMRKKPPRQVAFARRLRSEMTDAERVLWRRLRSRQMEGAKFRRQEPIGPYVVDFVSVQERLIVEIDGGQHNEENARQRDQKRTEWLRENGYRIIRFWNNDVLENTEGVLEAIRETLQMPSLSPSPQPSPCRERENLEHRPEPHY
jgi:very-short-patch-repair endonuclease